MNLTFWLTIWLLLPSLLGCSSVSVSIDFDESETFSNLQTYAWTTPSKKDDKNKLDDPKASLQIKMAIEQQLDLKGYERVTENPDFLLASHASKVDRSFTLQPYASGSATRPSRYKEDTVVIEIFNPETSKLIWWANARFVLGLEDDPETETKQVNEVVQKILEKFPPKRKI